MKILFDSQIFDWQINGGISRYFTEVIHRLHKNANTEVLFEVKHSYNTYIQHTPWLKNNAVFRKIHFAGKLGALKIINQKVNRVYSNRLLKTGIPDIFHPTYYDPYFLPFLNGKLFVLTVYDLTNEKFNDHKSHTAKVMGWKKELIQAADHIISISDNTKKDIVEYYNVEPEKITTAHLSGGFDVKIRQAGPVPEMNGIPEKYILFVGVRSEYKNFNAFIHEVAATIIKQKINLVIAGGGPMSEAELDMFKKLGVADKVIYFAHVSDTFLAQLYSKALLFIFPSLYEGFGIPVLEAMQCGCPVLSSNNSSLPEVGGNAAAYFDPFVQGSLQAKLEQLLDNENERQRMKEDGLEQVKKFNWNATAKKHMEVYAKLLS